MDRTGNGIGSGPCRLKIKAPCDTVNVEYLTGEIEVRHVFAFQRGGMDGREGDAATGDELILERRTTDYLIIITTAKQIGQALLFFLIETTPAPVTPFAQALTN